MAKDLNKCSVFVLLTLPRWRMILNRYRWRNSLCTSGKDSVCGVFGSVGIWEFSLSWFNCSRIKFDNVVTEVSFIL